MQEISVVRGDEQVLRTLAVGLLAALISLTAVAVSGGPALAQTTSGPTEAPDLVSVGNFRAGPPSDDGNPQTLVDYTFDQVVYLKGGDRSSFHLVPLDAGDAVDARSPQPEGDAEGDNVVTVLYSGDIAPADYARGYVDSNVATSRRQGANRKNPLNINQSEPVSNSGKTQNPDLISATYDGGDQVVYEFDQPLTTDDVIQNTSGLRVYFPQTDVSAIRDVGAQTVRRESPTNLRAFFADDLPGGKDLSQASGAFVAQGTVQAAQGSRGGNDGKNAFDELAPLQNSGRAVCAPPEGAGGTGAGNGPTAAPDLTSVGNFRPGPATAQGTPTTCVDFTFDQLAYLVGSNRTSFSLVPQNGGDALSAGDIIPRSDQEGDNIVTAVFPGDLSPQDFPRGFLATGVVSSRQQGANSKNPLNINQSADISNGGKTQNPDLISATYDGGDQVVYEFDQPLTTDDVIQNTSGLRVYFPEAENANRIREAGAQSVKRESPTKLRAFFADDLPGGRTLADAAGAFVAQGTVQAVQGSRGSNDGTNAFDELAPLQNSGRTVCAAPENVGGTGAGNGPTEAPDLVSVGNFRAGPATSQGTQTTCVDFTFDQVAYLVGSNRTSFHLIPEDAGDALDADDIVPQSDQAGDNIVTVAFPGDLSPADFPRGFLDSKVVTSRKQGANRKNPLNINQSADISNGGKTQNPDLVSVRRDGDQVLYKFDQPLTNDDVIQNTGGLQLYFPETDTNAVRQAGAQSVKELNSTTLRAYFGTALPGGRTLDDAVGGFVQQGTVQAAPGSGGGNSGKNAFDELTPIGTTGAEVCAAPETAGGTGTSNGPTEAPDLTSVGNFRRGPFTSQFTPTTCVNFTFDQVAYLNGGDKSNFQIVPLDAGDAISGSTNVRAASDQPGDNIVTVVFPGDLDPADFARGYVDSGVVNSAPNNVSKENPYNVNQSEDISPNAVTKNPDLVQVSRDGDSFLYKFDQALTDDDVIQNTSGLRLYFPQARQGSTIPAAGALRVEAVNSTTLRAFFSKDLPGNYALSDAVGAFVQQGTVQAAVGSRGGNDGKNAFDELRLSGSVAGISPDRIRLTSICVDGQQGYRFRVRNLNEGGAVPAGALTYDVAGQTPSGTLGKVPATGETFFFVDTPSNPTVRLFYKGELIETKAANEVGCTTTVETRVASSRDDVEQAEDSGNMNFTSGDLDMARAGSEQRVGVRFKLEVPQGATIEKAYIQFTADENQSGPTDLRVKAQTSNDSSAFNPWPFDLSSRPTTSGSVPWSPAAWEMGAAGSAQRTPDLTSLVQTVVSNPNWSSGNNSVFIVAGSGKRSAVSYDTSPASAPLLHVEYSQ